MRLALMQLRQLFLAEIVATFSSRHPDYAILAGRVYTSYIHKRVPKQFSVWALSQDICELTVHSVWHIAF